MATDRKKLEEKIRLVEEELRLLNDAVPPHGEKPSLFMRIEELEDRLEQMKLLAASCEESAPSKKD